MGWLAVRAEGAPDQVVGMATPLFKELGEIDRLKRRQIGQNHAEMRHCTGQICHRRAQRAR